LSCEKYNLYLISNILLCKTFRNFYLPKKHRYLIYYKTNILHSVLKVWMCSVQ